MTIQPKGETNPDFFISFFSQLIYMFTKEMQDAQKAEKSHNEQQSTIRG